jgi:HTH-type transcriptional regulator/antitoxin HigA
LWLEAPEACKFDFEDSLESAVVIPWLQRRGTDATEVAGDDGGRRSVSRQAGSDHQPETRAGAAPRQDRLGLDRSRRWIEQVVGEFCIQRVPLDHTVVLHFRGICRRSVIDPGNLRTLGGPLYASAYSGRSPILGCPKGLLLYRCGFRAACGLVHDACGSSTPGRWALCSHLVVDWSNERTKDELDPIDVLRYAIDELGHTQAELAEPLGSRSRASDVLSRRRALTLEMIHKLGGTWKIPADLLVRPCKTGQAA